MHLYVCVYIYAYMYRERKREKERDLHMFEAQPLKRCEHGKKRPPVVRSLEGVLGAAVCAKATEPPFHLSCFAIIWRDPARSLDW